MEYIIYSDSRSQCGVDNCGYKHWNTLRHFNEWYIDYGKINGFDTSSIKGLLMFGVKPLLDDIYNLAYIQGNAEKNQLEDSSKGARALSYYISISDKINLPIVRRSIDLAVSECEHLTYILSRHSMSEDMCIDNHLDENKYEYIIEMKVPEGFSDTSMWHLLRGIHDYIVDKVLWEWSKLTYPKFADYWKEKMDSASQLIKDDCELTDGDKIARLIPAW